MIQNNMGQAMNQVPPPHTAGPPKGLVPAEGSGFRVYGLGFEAWGG